MARGENLFDGTWSMVIGGGDQKTGSEPFLLHILALAVIVVVGWSVGQWDDGNLLWGMLFASFSGCKWEGLELD